MASAGSRTSCRASQRSTARSLVAAVSDLKTHAALQTRVGIATGLVVVGDLIGSGASQEQAIVGETPNLAARLQGVAEPNSVVIAESTRRLVGNLFELRDIGPQELKGLSGAVRAWAALRPSSVESRLDAFHASGVTELVGRQEELELLLRRWLKAKVGEGQVVLLSGEPGIGKSRLTAALLERLASKPHTRLRYFCSPQHTDSAFYPIISQMERAAGLAHDDTTRAKLDKLDAGARGDFNPYPGRGPLCRDAFAAERWAIPPARLGATERRQKTQEALAAQLAGLTRQRPALMIVEDAHWVDPTSLEVFGRTVDQIETLPVLLIVTFRPEFDAPWAGRSHVTSLARGGTFQFLPRGPGAFLEFLACFRDIHGQALDLALIPKHAKHAANRDRPYCNMYPVIHKILSAIAGLPRFASPRQPSAASLRAKAGGEGGIRTPVGVKPKAVFKTAAIDHSATSPDSQTGLPSRSSQSSCPLATRHRLPPGWHGRRDLNPQPTVLETATLPIELLP